MSDYLEIVGSDGVTYRLKSGAELESEAQAGDELAKEILSWRTQNTYIDRVFVSDEIVETLKQAFHSVEERLAALQVFSPPTAGLTHDDFLVWVVGKIRDYRERYRHNSFGHNNAVHLGSWEHQYYSTGWRGELVSARSNLPAGANRWSSPAYKLASILEDAWAPRKKTPAGADYAQGLLFLNEYLWGDGREFKGTFGEYVTSEDKGQAVAQRVEQYLFVEHKPDSMELLMEFGNSRNVATFNHAAQVRVKDLLYAQDREMWTKLIAAAPKYTKGKTFKHLQELLSDLEVDLGRSGGHEYPIYSPEKLRREFTLLVAEGIMFEGPYYDPKKLHGLATVALKAVPAERELERFAKEYSHILHLVRSKLEAHKTTAEWEIMLAEGVEQEELRKAAEKAGKLTLMQTVGLLMATFFPRTWLRGNSENGPFIMVDLLQTRDDVALLQLLSEIIFEVHPAVPTETEWRKSVGEVDFAMPASFFLPMVVSSTAMSKGARKAYPEIVHEARAIFGVKRHGWR